MTIVLGSLHADIVQRWSITQIILRSVGVGMKHKLRLAYLLRLRGSVTEKIVEVGIHAEQHLLRRAGNHRHQHLLTLGQILTVGYRDLKTEIGVIEMVENRSPEGHILVTLDIYIHLLTPIIHLAGRDVTLSSLLTRLEG